MDDAKSNQDKNKTPEELQANIASTRERISQDIDALSDRVSPERFKEQAQETLSDAQETVMNTVNDVSHKVGARAQEASSSLFDMLKSHPVPAALIGLGVGLLVAGGATVAGSSSSDDGYDSYGTAYRGFDRGTGSTASNPSAYGDMSSNDKLVGAKALPRTSYGNQNSGGNYSGQSHNPGSQGQGVTNWIEDHPLAVGAVTLLIGAAIGLSMPGTRYENEVMGEASDASVQRAKSAVGDAVDVVKESASQATQAVKDELHERGTSKEGLKDTVKAAAETVTNEAKDAAKNVVDKTKQKAEEAANERSDKQNDGQKNSAQQDNDKQDNKNTDNKNADNKDSDKNNA